MQQKQVRKYYLALRQNSEQNRAMLLLLTFILCLFISVSLLLLSAVATFSSSPDQLENPVADDRLTIVIVTIASDKVWETLSETIDETEAQFDNYDICVLTDEGADRMSELRSISTIDTLAVPESFEPENATAKGRAIEWFIQNHVDENKWYAFIDDDNRIMDDRFLYEIPAQERNGYRAANPTLIPREGDSLVAFVVDHVRTLFDLTVYKASTGSGYPIFGLHGELLLVRGDVLARIGFDRDTIAEDFAFADALYRNGINTWQTATNVSILSPHSLPALFKQRRRWLVGQLQVFPNASIPVKLTTIWMHGTWSVGILTNWLLGVLYFATSNASFPQVAWLIGWFGATVYTITYATGFYRAGLKSLLLLPLLPAVATLEHLLPIAILISELLDRNNTEFTVIDK